MSILLVLLLLLPVLAMPLRSAAQVTVNDTTSSLSLADLWEKAGQNNKIIRLKLLELKEKEEGLRNAKAAKLPDIDLDGEYARLSNLPQYTNGLFHSPTYYPIPNYSYSLGATVRYNLYHGGDKNRAVLAEKTGVKIAEQQHALSLSEIKLLTASYYLDLLRGKAFEKLLTNDIKEQQKVLLQIRTLYQHGVVLKSDVLRAELKLNDQQFRAEQIRNDNLILAQKLNLLSGRPDDAVIEPAHPFLPDTVQIASYEHLLEKTFSGAQELEISKQQQLLSALRLRDARSSFLPRVDLFANYAYSYPQGRFYPYSLSVYGFGAAGIHASLPISALFKNKHQVSIAAIEVQKSRVEHQETEDQLKNQLKEAWLKFREEQDRIGVARHNVVQATENLRIIRNSYLNQTSLITDYLDADLQLLQANFELTAASAAAELRYYQLLKITGDL